MTNTPRELTAATTIPSDVLVDNYEGEWVWVKGTYTRNKARMIAVAEFGCDYIEVVAKRCYMRPFPDADDIAEYADDDCGPPDYVAIQCEKNCPNAEPWWACEMVA